MLFIWISLAFVVFWLNFTCKLLMISIGKFVLPKISINSICSHALLDIQSSHEQQPHTLQNIRQLINDSSKIPNFRFNLFTVWWHQNRQYHILYHISTIQFSLFSTSKIVCISWLDIQNWRNGWWVRPEQIIKNWPNYRPNIQNLFAVR